MHGLTEAQLLAGLAALAVILVCARGMGEMARRLGQPEVVGELFAGFLLGPSVFGALAPAASHALFYDSGVSLVLSGFSWVGAILLLLIAGMEADLDILRAEARPGALAGAAAITCSLVAGVLFAWLALGRPLRYALFLGVVLSVTAVSVAAKILIEREVLRRRYAQVILAAGIASEVAVWLLVSIVASEHSASPVLVVLRSAAYAVAFFAFMLILGTRFTPWVMRRVADSVHIARGPLSLVLILTFLAAAVTQALGLHALLGAFVFGVLLARSPRTNRQLIEGVQALTSALFAPIFFALAGMRVDILLLRSWWAVGMVGLLLVVATVVKVGAGTLGAWAGGLSRWEAALVGVGLNLKGGTDVIVAIVGVELGLLSARTYTMYTVVAIATVLFSPPLLAYLERRAPPAQEEVARLEREEAERRAYVPGVERVLVPVTPQLFPALAADVVQHIAISKHDQGQIFDITQLSADGLRDAADTSTQQRATRTLSTVGTLKTVEVTRRRGDVRYTLKEILEAASDHQLTAIGARPVTPGRTLSFGPLQDAIIRHARTDVLVVVSEEEHLAWSAVRRILVPVNGQEYAMAAGDVAAHLAQACDAELVVLHVARPDLDPLFWRQHDHRLLRRYAQGMVGEMAFRAQRLGVRVTERVEIDDVPGMAIARALRGGDFQLVVLGGLERGIEGSPHLGHTIRTVLTRSQTPALLLIAKGRGESSM